MQHPWRYFWFGFAAATVMWVALAQGEHCDGSLAELLHMGTLVACTGP